MIRIIIDSFEEPENFWILPQCVLQCSRALSTVVVVRYYVVIAVPEYTISVLMCQSRRGVRNPGKNRL